MARELPGKIPEDLMARYLWLLSGVLAAGIGIGCRTNETPESQVNDVEITAQVKSKLASDMSLSTVPNVSVNSTNGVVTLSGAVNSGTDKTKAGQIAAAVPKVVRVDNNLQVAVQPGS
jgi:osmotically-inducible protein OsmY